MSMFASPRCKSMRTRSPVRNSASPPPAAASGDALRIDGEPEVPDWRRSPMQGVDAGLSEPRRRPHVDPFGGAGIAERSGAAHEQQGPVVDPERGIVD